MIYCRNHELHYFELKNGNLLSVCGTCGLHTEVDKETGIPIYELERLKYALR